MQVKALRQRGNEMSENKENRKQLTREYKERKKQIGVFVIRNKITGRVFLDRSLSLDMAYNKHRFSLNFGNHRNKELQADWTRHGEENFEYEVIERLEEKPGGARDINVELDELKELCREKIVETSGVKGLY
jgi:hypothetical protein